MTMKLLLIKGPEMSAEGESWARQEVENPMRTIAQAFRSITEISVGKRADKSPGSVGQNSGGDGGDTRRVSLSAPVEIGDVIVPSPAGCDTEVVATRRVRKIV